MNLIKVGYITNTHGIKGDIKIYPLTEYPDRFEEDVDFYIDEKIRVNITKVRYNRGLVYVSLKGYDNINQVLGFKDKYIYVKEEDAVALPEDNYFISDLVGMEVVDRGKVVGHVEEVLLNSTNDIYRCVAKDGREFMIPAVKAFIKEIDVKNKKLHVELIEGML
ncbi:ribosome maturation factor RimM [Lagierella sp.]|uniref:ribosome maturation factor RimM n=1 Tax=Lagierella sp. TaxID=2849657 RepID=UPI002620E202|nr:ribosome maturation factor RimM [Lagierella sp.]